MKRGVLGGTFDPIHQGHLDVALAALHQMPLDEVTLVPSRIPPHREAPHASAAHRFAMVALAIQRCDGLKVSDVELYGEGPSYTSMTLDRLAGTGWDLGSVYFVTGADAFRDIATWRDYPALLDRCHFVVVSRPGCPAPSLRTALPTLASRMREPGPWTGTQPGIFLVDVPTAPVSSTDVRRHLAAGRGVVDLVPAEVAAHIDRHDLYRTRREGRA
jgi:nicotinate-nucleotide adenylyltransferase